MDSGERPHNAEGTLFEVYLNNPNSTTEENLLTEIYVPVET